jgi:hypothetical protein
MGEDSTAENQGIEIDPIVVSTPESDKLFSRQFTLLLCGITKAGKSTIIVNILLNPAFGIEEYYDVKNILIFSKTLFIDKVYAPVVRRFDKLGLINRNLYTSLDSNLIHNLVNVQTEKMTEDPRYKDKKKSRYLVIIDDSIGDAALNPRSLFASETTRIRHPNISFIFSVQ